MAKRRQAKAADVPLMPRELLEPRNRAVRFEWFAHYGLTGVEQSEAVARARREHGVALEQKPDPREMFRNLANNAAPLRPRRGHKTHRREDGER